ncbi:MAG: MoaD/ThiS family protein [Tissierellia bacterium]|nr:MoaD/ThiS family protein [Tissierellia bacterium]
MKVEVRYFATLRSKGIKKETIELPNEMQVSELLEKLNIKDEDVAILLVNGIITTSDTIIQDKDTISLFPPVGGG